MLTVIIPTYNAWPVVADAVASASTAGITAKTRVVVVDDGSTDSTACLIQPSQLHEVIRQPNLGRCVARNVGAASVTSEWLAFLDADDKVTDSFHQTVDSVLPHVPLSVEVVRFAVLYTNGEEQAQVRIDYPTDNLLEGPFIPGSYIIRAETFRRIGGFDGRISYSENSELFFRLYCEFSKNPEHGRVLALRNIGVVHRHRPNVNDYYREARVSSVEHFLHIHADALRLHPHLWSQKLSILANDRFRQGHRLEALKHSCSAFIRSPTFLNALRVARYGLARSPKN